MSDRVDILGLTSAQLGEAAALTVGVGAGAAPRLYHQAMHGGALALAEARLGEASATRWRAHFQVGLLEVARVMSEETEAAGAAEAGTAAGATEEPLADAPAPVKALPGTAKAVLRTADGYEIECVRIPMRHGPDSHRTWTLCLSSQVGCRMGCGFCETGRMGLLRNLTAAEIVAQVVTVQVRLGWQARNLVFMGMGEALDNAEALLQALQVLTDRRGLHFSHERLTVCTSGHAEGIRRLAALGWKRLNLSISLNAGDDAVRSRLMPVNRRTPLAELQRLLADYPQRRNFTLGVNYCLMPGINDSAADASGVAAFCAPLGRVLINLIPYNPGTAPLTRSPTEEEIAAFIARLRGHGLPVRRRLTKGRGIMAACGQLGRRQARAPGAGRDVQPCAGRSPA